MSALPAAPDLPEIRLAGFLHSGLGLGETGRLVAQSLRSAGVPLVTQTWLKQAIDTVPFETSGAPSPGAPPGGTDRRPGISLLCMNGEHLSDFLGTTEAGLLHGNNYIISIWFWELPELSRESRAGFQYVDEVWAASPFIRDALARHSGDIPVRIFNHPVPPPGGDEAAARARFPFDGRFVFLFSFDYQSCPKRKNPDGYCEAFAMAFPVPLPGGPLCVVKSINAAQHPVADVLLRRRWAHRPDILFMDEFLSPADRDLLTWRAGACVSLHRSEGLGLTLLEAMSLGKPCIATAYSGNLSFMLPDNSWLVPCTPVKVGRGSAHYPAEQLWAEPDPAAAAAAMREVFAGSPEVHRRAAAGAAYVRQHHDPAVCGRHLAALLAEAAGKPPRPSKNIGSGRAGAYAALADLRDAETRDPLPPPSWLKLGGALQDLARKTRRTARTERQVMSRILTALKQQEDRHRVSQEIMQRRLDRLDIELSQVLALLPPPPVLTAPPARD